MNGSKNQNDQTDGEHNVIAFPGKQVNGLASLLDPLVLFVLKYCYHSLANKQGEGEYISIFKSNDK